MFKLKDKVVYPGHGVAIVDEIIEKNVGGKPVHFMKLVFLFKDMNILVPTYNMSNVGIRNPSDEETIEQAFGELNKKPEKKLESVDFTPSGWNKRHKEYQFKIQSGRLLDIAKVYRDLMYIAQQKELSFGERTLLGLLEDLMVQEIQVGRDVGRDAAMQELRSPFKQHSFFNSQNWLQQAAPSLG